MRIARIIHVGLFVFCAVFLLERLWAQETDWDRSISAGDSAMAKHQYAEAETLYRAALAIAEKRWKKDARLSASLWKLAESCSAQGKKQEAEALANRASASMDEALSAHKPRNSSDEYQQVTASTALFDKAGDLFAENQNDHEAEGLYEKSLKRWRNYVSNPPAANNNEDAFRFWIKVQQDTPVKFLGAGMKLGAFYEKEGKSKEAITLYRELATTTEKLYDAKDPQTVPSLTRIAASEFRLGDYEGAEPLCKRVIEVLESAKFKDSATMASALENYAALLKKTGRDGAAKLLLDRAGLIRANSSAVQQ